jgi:hypothetical protein
MHVGNGDWAVFDGEAPDAHEVDVLELKAAIDKARGLVEKRDD